MTDINKAQLEEKYNKLKSLFIDHIETGFSGELYYRPLKKLKEDFFDDVRSVRQLDAVENVAGLIRLLEKRLLLGWFNVDPFKMIIKEYDMDGDSTNRYIEYVEVFEKYRSRNGKVFSTYPYDPDVLRDVPPNREVIPKQIAEYICNEMKGKWKDFGRELVEEDLASEGQLDKLIDSDETSAENTQQLLDLFVGGDKRNKMSHLCEILRKVNNKLAEEVSDKITKHFQMN